MNKSQDITFFAYIKDFLSSIWVVWGIVAVQLIIILLFVSHSSKNKRISVNLAKKNVTSKNMRQIGIIFIEDAYEKDIRKFLFDLNGSIVSGPSSEGQYIIEFNVLLSALDETVKLITENSLIKFVLPQSVIINK